MRRILVGLAVASSAVIPLSGGVAQALDGANTFGITAGKSVLVTNDPAATCNPLSPTSASDALCKYHVTGKFSTSTSPVGPSGGTYVGTVVLDYAFGPAAQQSCASVSGAINFFVRQNGKYGGQFKTQLSPATVSQPDLSKACSTSQSPADSDVSSTYFVGTIVSGKVSGIPLCGSTENRGSSIRNHAADGTPTTTMRDHSNSQAILGIKGGTLCPPAA